MMWLPEPPPGAIGAQSFCVRLSTQRPNTVNDSEFKLYAAMRLPTFDVDEMRLVNRPTVVARSGRSSRFLSVFPPDESADQVVMLWLRDHHVPEQAQRSISVYCSPVELPILVLIPLRPSNAALQPIRSDAIGLIERIGFAALVSGWSESV
jgi:hypothetical protein